MLAPPVPHEWSHIKKESLESHWCGWNSLQNKSLSSLANNNRDLVRFSGCECKYGLLRDKGTFCSPSLLQEVPQRCRSSSALWLCFEVKLCVCKLKSINVSPSGRGPSGPAHLVTLPRGDTKSRYRITGSERTLAFSPREGLNKRWDEIERDIMSLSQERLATWHFSHQPMNVWSGFFCCCCSCWFLLTFAPFSTSSLAQLVCPCTQAPWRGETLSRVFRFTQLPCRHKGHISAPGPNKKTETNTNIWLLKERAV